MEAAALAREDPGQSPGYTEVRFGVWRVVRVRTTGLEENGGAALPVNGRK
jgi:hypothetical protein